MMQFARRQPRTSQEYLAIFLLNGQTVVLAGVGIEEFWLNTW